jgi:hypothetical protein
VKTKVVPPRQAEKLAKKIPIKISRIDVVKNKRDSF